MPTDDPKTTEAAPDARAIIQAASAIIVDAALNLIQSDPHQWSERPCSTCRAVTTLIGRRFGCYAYTKRVSPT